MRTQSSFAPPSRFVFLHKLCPNHTLNEPNERTNEPNEPKFTDIARLAVQKRNHKKARNKQHSEFYLLQASATIFFKCTLTGSPSFYVLGYSAGYRPCMPLKAECRRSKASPHSLIVLLGKFDSLIHILLRFCRKTN